MIFQQVYGLGRGEVTILGVPGETVTYTGKDSGSVALDGNGEATVVLRAGNYDFVGSISQKSGVLRENTQVRPGDTVTMWPQGARILYWLGRYGVDDDGQAVTNYHTVTSGRQNRFAAESDYLHHEVYYGSEHTDDTAYAKLTFSKIDLTPYSKAKVSIKKFAHVSNGVRTRKFGYASTTPTSSSMVGSIEYDAVSGDDGAEIFECPLTGVNDEYYLGVHFGISTSYRKNNYAYTEVYALWVEE